MALSLVGLAIQVIVFSLVDVSWFGRINFDSAQLTLFDYMLIGLPIIDSIIFAIVQLVLLCLVLYRKWRVMVRKLGPTETAPLLGQDEAR